MWSLPHLIFAVQMSISMTTEHPASGDEDLAVQLKALEQVI